MSTLAGSDPLPLATALTKRTRDLCIGLEQGTATLYDLVTPMTADLLHWWFGEDACASRRANFHPGQRQAILNVIVAHEVLGGTDLADLYRKACADALLEGGLLAEVTQDKHAHPKYCLKMATGTGKTWVLQALLVWQLLNKTVALEEGIDDARFTRRFLIVAPGLIVYERLLDAFLGKERADGLRDFATSDIATQAELFMPPAWRERVEQFVRSNVCTKAEIGLKATGNGLIAITNWHLLAEAGDEEEAVDEVELLDAPAMVAEPATIAYQVLPLTPGRATGNSLDVLDRRWARGNVLSYLADLPDLLVFNDEAHHIHDFKREGETTEVEWQKSLTRIAAGKGRRFVQVDFSATPYNQIGSGRKQRKAYFPHIAVDFDLREAMRLGLVKSLVLDKRKELGALPLEFKADRDDDGNAELSTGQRVMLRAGLQKLRKLEADFARLDPERHPKMLVVCEDTKITPLVAEFLQGEGLHEDDVLTVDSGKKAELGEKEWAPLRQRLFDGATPLRILRQRGQHLPPCGLRLGLSPFLCKAEGEIEACLGVGWVELQCRLEGLLRVGGDDAASLVGDRLAKAGPARRRVAIQPDGVAIGGDSIGKALQAQIDRRQHIPTPAIRGIGGEMRLGARDQFVNGAVGWILGQPFGQRLGRQVWRADLAVKAPTHQRHGEHGRSRHQPRQCRTAAGFRLPGLIRPVEAQDAPRDLGPCLLGLRRLDQAAGRIAVELLELVAVDFEVMVGA